MFLVRRNVGKQSSQDQKMVVVVCEFTVWKYLAGTVSNLVEHGNRTRWSAESFALRFFFSPVARGCTEWGSWFSHFFIFILSCPPSKDFLIVYFFNRTTIPIPTRRFPRFFLSFYLPLKLSQTKSRFICLRSARSLLKLSCGYFLASVTRKPFGRFYHREELLCLDMLVPICHPVGGTRQWPTCENWSSDYPQFLCEISIRWFYNPDLIQFNVLCRPRMRRKNIQTIGQLGFPTTAVVWPIVSQLGSFRYVI